MLDLKNSNITHLNAVNEEHKNNKKKLRGNPEHRQLSLSSKLIFRRFL